jgi:hypothetical protein
MNSNAKLHVFYTFAMLLATIVALITVEWGGITDLVGYINFSAAVSSLILAVLAIVYAYLSTNSQAQQIGVLQAAAREVAQSAAEVKAASSELHGRIAVIPDELKNMGKRFDETQSAIASLAQRAAPDPPKSAADTAKADPSAETVRRFLTKVSLNGAAGLYAAVQAHDREMPLNLRELAKQVPTMGSYEYQWGFLIAARSSDMLTFADDVNSNVTSISSVLGSEVRQAVLQRGTTLDNKYPKLAGKQNFTQRAADTIAAIDKFYSREVNTPDSSSEAPPPTGDEQPADSA